MPSALYKESVRTAL